MFQAEIKSEILKEIIGIVDTLVDEAKFNVEEDGITLRAVDPAHVAMVDLSISAAAFEEFKADGIQLGIDIDKLKDVLKLAKGSDIISLFHDVDRNRLILKVVNVTRRMALVDTTSMTDPKVPNIDLPSKVVIATDQVLNGIKASEPISEHIALIASPDGFELSSEGDTDSVNLKLPKDLLKELECEETVKSLFSLNYFGKMIKACKAPMITINLGTDYPVKIEYDIAEDTGHVRYLLAPRIESD